jgi:prepilin peptidase CpaA
MASVFAMTHMSIVQIASVVVALIACVTDLHSRRIPNWLTGGALLAAMAYHLLAGSPNAALWSMAGAAVGLLLFLPIYALRGMGAGDVKLLAALGAWLGLGDIVWVALYAAMIGGMLALLLALGRGYLRQLLSNLWLLLTHWRVAGVRPLDTLTLQHGRGPRLAYAVPITFGLGLMLWLQ